METSFGNITSSIWLIGDSAPLQWIKDLKHPLDQRHPTVHNIWTPIIYRIQKHIFTEKSIIIVDEENIFFIRNAVHNDNQKPARNVVEWNEAMNKKLIEMKDEIHKHNPKMIITFGAFAFEFLQRCTISNSDQRQKYGYWGAEKLGEIFVNNVKNKEVIVPLLHTSICKRHWLESKEKFTRIKDGN